MKLLEINTRKILFEEFENETVLVNTESGFYYSLSSTGTLVLQLINDGWPTNMVSEKLFGTDAPSSIHAEIDTFLCRLLEEEIVVEKKVNEWDAPATTSSEAALPASEKYDPPVLERFDDVRELLLIDPVHQVDQQYGWPKAFREPSHAGVQDDER